MMTMNAFDREQLRRLMISGHYIGKMSASESMALDGRVKETAVQCLPEAW